MAPLTVGVYAETAPGERRVALVPESVGEVAALGAEVAVEAGAGAGARFADAAYAAAGAAVLTRARLFDRADVLVGIRPPGAGADYGLRPGQTLLALLQPLDAPLAVRGWADHGITALALDLMPLGLAPAMDAAASQARITGHEAVLLAAGHSARWLPGAADPERRVRVLVVGAGATGLQAMVTARGLGAAVQVGDVARRGAEGVLAVRGADYLDLSATGCPAAVRLTLTAVVPRFDAVVATPYGAPGAGPDLLVTADAVRAMRAGSAVVDTTVRPGAATVEGARFDDVATVGPGVTVIGAGNLPSRVPAAASARYAQHLTALLARLMPGGALTVDLADPVQAALAVTYGGAVRNEAVRLRLRDLTAAAGLP